MTDLTEQWKKGELKLGEHYYYTTIFSPTVYIQNFTRDVVSFQDFKETVAEVLAPVPSYSEYVALQSDSLHIAWKDIDKLKKVLKECESSIQYYQETYGVMDLDTYTLLAKLEALK